MNIWILIGIVLLDGILVATLVGGLSRVCWSPLWCGCTMVSVPWDQVLEHPQPGKSKWMVRVKIANQVVSGPRWALDCRLTLRKAVDGADAESEVEPNE